MPHARWPRRLRPRPTSSSARSSTTSARPSPCCCSPASTCSASPGCGSPPRRWSSPLAPAVARAAQLDRDGRALARSWGAVLALMNCCFYTAIDRLPLGHRRRDRVPARDRRWPRSGAQRAATRPRSRSPSPASTCSPTCGSRASRSGFAFAFANAALFALYIVLGRPRRAARRDRRHRRPRRCDADRRRRRHADRRLGGRCPPRRPDRDPAAGLGVGDLLLRHPLRLRPARDARAAARDLRADGLRCSRRRRP